ncbi:universal stress protein [Nostocoides sp. F2B08]|uniref:universal stress protein n=1 Tax=Nostocoides sp. F2B08 TaxID=2653936 RepID=UPI001262D8E5|nr:universal stress protein [Tetrasphaera sp. F2B08]KAB7743300.1 universal stress protein [Tetrasphaera sp. F2B08]
MPNELLVVGLDGTDRSHDALRFALTEARLRGGSVEVITAFTEDEKDGGRQKAEMIQEEARTTVLADHDGEPPVSFHVVAGRPEHILVDASSRASLLVVGAHGVESIMHTALGSISEYTARLAYCPVVVIPAPEPS